MGWGDALMATGEAKNAYAKKPLPVFFVGVGNRPQWSDVFEHNPKIIRRREGPHQIVVNGPNARPYIAAKNADRWYWRDYKPTPGEIVLTEDERAFAAPYSGLIMVEPNVKANGHTNKAWAWDRWQSLVDRIGPINFVQAGPVGTRWLDGVNRAQTETFRDACAVLARSVAFVATEGGLHHAAAAFNVPAVVLFSEFIAPSSTGYDYQTSIRHAGPACGSRVPCPTCAASMAAISVDEVANAVEAL